MLLCCLAHPASGGKPITTRGSGGTSVQCVSVKRGGEGGANDMNGRWGGEQKEVADGRIGMTGGREGEAPSPYSKASVLPSSSVGQLHVQKREIFTPDSPFFQTLWTQEKRTSKGPWWTTWVHKELSHQEIHHCLTSSTHRDYPSSRPFPTQCRLKQPITHAINHKS